jgi:hypothetical protein
MIGGVDDNKGAERAKAELLPDVESAVTGRE